MAIPHQGRETALMLGEEGTWGTAVARTVTAAFVVSAQLRRTRPTVPVPHLGYTGQTATTRRRRVPTEDTVGGSIEVVCTYDTGFDLTLLKHCLGAVTDGGSGPSSFTHAFTLATPLPVGLTVEQVLGTSGQSEVMEGGKVASWEWSCSVGDVARLSAELIGETSTRGAKGTPSYPSDPTPIQHWHAGVVTFNAVTYTVKSVRIRGDNKLERRQQLGSLNTAEPAPTEAVEVTLTAELEYASDAPHTAQLAQTQGDVTVSFTDGAKTIAWTLHNAEIVDDGGPVMSDQGTVTHTIEWSGMSDGTDQGLRCLITNDETLYSDNG